MLVWSGLVWVCQGFHVCVTRTSSHAIHVCQGKGGRTVYLGPTSEALPYFEGLGIVCPPLVNPPGGYFSFGYRLVMLGGLL